ncbi:MULTISPECIES: GAF and ANTAR domain-containing protein [Amycolatopsis]|uniref:GAF and ANTAR domain-containing protein n=1 Tax=Amycolatopsis dendrobii TaxID=2760662 RepID=A0A7W3ZG88_9PSEU|nr:MULTISPECIES: GAF and ANTAR domain-containing protein [Amycolatopsis]MBB1159868.1 GAF and ANTAR domain-containing protein [Amycolatopsis dendrobii]UKD59082.1 GAF and ANTAR domain-containing protein [Amycolatopsis sp. FU40]
MVIEQELARIYEAIRARALAEGSPVALRHVVQVCQEVLAADGVGVRLKERFGLGEPAYATDPRAERVLELQITVGEGPGLTALRRRFAVLSAELDEPRRFRQWPLFAPAVVEEGLRAVFAFPLATGAASLGVLEIYRESPHSLTDGELDLALTMVQVVTGHLLARVALTASGEAEAIVDERLYRRWRTVHSATGMAAAQLGCPVAEASLRLRAYAYVSGRRLSEVADDVVAGVLRLPPDHPSWQHDDDRDKNDADDRGDESHGGESGRHPE